MFLHSFFCQRCGMDGGCGIACANHIRQDHRRSDEQLGVLLWNSWTSQTPCRQHPVHAGMGVDGPTRNSLEAVVENLVGQL
jgi:hypothetical protein